MDGSLGYLLSTSKFNWFWALALHLGYEVVSTARKRNIATIFIVPIGDGQNRNENLPPARRTPTVQGFVLPVDVIV
jgi:hypothetical protein